MLVLTLMVPAALTFYVWEKTAKRGLRAELSALTGCWIGFGIVIFLGLAL